MKKWYMVPLALLVTGLIHRWVVTTFLVRIFLVQEVIDEVTHVSIGPAYYWADAVICILISITCGLFLRKQGMRRGAIAFSAGITSAICLVAVAVELATQPEMLLTPLFQVTYTIAAMHEIFGWITTILYRIPGFAELNIWLTVLPRILSPFLLVFFGHQKPIANT